MTRRKIVTCFSSVDNRVWVWLLVLSLCLVEDLLLQLSSRGQVRADFPKACAHLRCKRSDQCVSRKFWCKNPPCPSMLYCSKSRKESLKGPSSCEDVRCSNGFVCRVRARHCGWDGVCAQQIARCVSERDYFEGPTTCVDFQCPSGRRCILRESFCAEPPCKLLKSCPEMKDVKDWLQKCRNLGCPSEHECFLRRPDQNCSGSACKHSPDCTTNNETELEVGEQCRGWVCPKGKECTVHTKGPCKRRSCRIFRSCHELQMNPAKNSSKKSPLLSPPTTDNAFWNQWAELDEKKPLNFDINTFNSSSKAGTNEAPNSRLGSAKAISTSGEVVKPTAMSLTTWLNHLKMMTGVEAVETWITRAERQENHQGFLEWLKSVKDMLGQNAYDLWLEEVRAMTVTDTAFQQWLPPSPANRSTDSHRLVRIDGNVARAGYETSRGTENSKKSRNIAGENDDRSRGNVDETEIKKYDIKNAKYVFQLKNETPVTQSEVTYNNGIPQVPVFPRMPTTIGINDWSRLQSFTPTNSEQTYPAVLPQHFENIVSWKGFPYGEFENTALSKPVYPKFSSNWSFPILPAESPVFGPKTWPDQYLPSVYPQWQPTADRRNEISRNQGIFVASIGSEPVFPSSMEAPINFYPQNSTNQAVPWVKSFNERYETPEFITPDNFAAYRISDRNFIYPSWPESGYGQSYRNVAHRRTKDNGVEAQKFSYDGKNGERSENKLPALRKNPSLYYPEYSWGLNQPRLRDDYLRSLNYNRRNLHQRNNQNGLPVLPALSRNHRIGPLSPHNPHVSDNKLGIPQSEYHWTSSYPDDRRYEILATSSPSSGLPFDGSREIARQILPSVKLNPFDDDEEERGRFLVGDRINDVPGQSMELPDFWNSRYKNPSDSLLRKIVREGYPSADVLRNRAPATDSPLTAIRSREVVSPRDESVTTEKIRDDRISNDDATGYADYFAEGEGGVYPLMLSLQGYVESPSRQVFQDTSNFRTNSNILPIYTIVNGAVNDYYNDDYEATDEGKDMNFFRDENYGGRADFPNNLKDVFEVEAALIMQNQSGNDDVKIKGMQWEYEYDEDSSNEDPVNLQFQNKEFLSPTDTSSKDDPVRGWIINPSGAWNDEPDYYDERDEYFDENFRDNKSSIVSDQINTDVPSNRKELPENRNDRFYDDVRHKTFKKNSPL